MPRGLYAVLTTVFVRVLVESIVIVLNRFSLILERLAVAQSFLLKEDRRVNDGPLEIGKRRRLLCAHRPR